VPSPAKSAESAEKAHRRADFRRKKAPSIDIEEAISNALMNEAS
jgi:hypothetical protein